MSTHQENKTKNLPAKMNNGIPEVTCEDLHTNMIGLHLVDVRGADEFHGELGHVPGAHIATLGPELSQFLKTANPHETYVFICRSGGRSGKATAEALQCGLKSVYNMQGGMLRWNELKFAVQRL